MFKRVFFGLFLLLFYFLSRQVLAYDEKTTHPALTSEIVEFYNIGSGAPITPDQKEWIVEGSIDEDTAPRWINHFYDPVHNTGWTGDKTGSIPASTVQALSRIGLSPEAPLSAIDWATNPLIQERYGRYGGNRTWQKGLEYYANGDLKEAYLTLGHILHLLEDLSVPDHTRDDTHAHGVDAVTGDEGSPFEDYAEQWTRSTLHIAQSLKNAGYEPIRKSSIQEYFATVAQYSNHYFFSKDTINDPKYEFPKIVREDENFGYGLDEHGKEFPLVRIKSKISNNNFKKEYSIKDSKDEEIFNAYFSRLSKEAVLAGVGLIELFQKQGEDAIVNKEYPTHLVRVDVSRIANLFPDISLVGEYYRLRNATQSFFANLAATTRKFLANVARPAPVVVLTDQRSPENQNMNNTPPQSEHEVQNATTPSVPTSTHPLVSQELIDTLNNTAQEFSNAASPQAGRVFSTSSLPVPTPASSTLKTNRSSSTGGSGLVTLGSGGVVATTATGGGSGSSVRTNEQETIAPSSSSSSASSTLQSSSTPTTSATSTLFSTSSTVFSSTPVLISEVLFDAAGGDEGKEFIELYNPNDTDVNIAGWSLKYRKGEATSAVSLASFKNASDTTLLHPHAFLLVGLNNYNASATGVVADVLRSSASLPNGASEGQLQNITLLLNSTSSEVDRIVYNASSVLATGESLERKALQAGSCTDPFGTGEFLGNACDSTELFSSSTLASRAVPRPQNSLSLPEPRNAPATPAPRSASSALAQYTSSTLKILFSFADSPDVQGATSTVLYGIRDARASTTVQEASSTSFSYVVSDVGRDYLFELYAQDRDGLRSASTSSTVPVASFLKNILVYADPRKTSSSRYVADFFYDGVPFIPDIFGRNMWQAMVLYKNRPANASNTVLNTEGNHLPADKTGVVATLIFALSPEFATGQGGGLSNKSFTLPQEDGHLQIYLNNVEANSLKAEDYFTVGYYDFSRSGGGTQDLSLVATDAHHYPFLSSPPQQSAPTSPQELSFVFNSTALTTTANWSTSTDPDSPDSSITYEINISSSTELSSSSWRSVGVNTSYNFSVTIGEQYKIGVRAVDDFGNKSSEKTASWSFPADFSPVKFSVSLPSASQDFVLNATATLQSITVHTSQFSTDSRNPDTNVCSLALYEVKENGNPKLLAKADKNKGPDGSSEAYSYRGENCAGDLTYTFADHPQLSASTTYRWVYDFSVNKVTVKFVGFSSNTVGGLFSDSSLVNAKFSVVGESGTLFSN